MYIALCDDEKGALLMLQDIVRSFCNARGLDAGIDLFPSGEDFLLSSRKYDVVFMDIYLPGINGLDAVGQYRRRGQIVFTTISEDHAVKAFGLNATHYLVKPLTVEAVTEAMERCLVRLGKVLETTIMVKTNQRTVSVQMKQIQFIEVFNKLCLIHTEKNEFRTYTSLDALFEQLDDSFLRLQRSYVVNMNFIESFLFDRVILKNNMEIMLSRSNRSEMKKQYQSFLFQMARGDLD